MKAKQKAKLKRYIKKKYYKNDKKVIVVHVKDEDELYSSLDPYNDTLSQELTNYLERSVETLLPLNKIQIKIQSRRRIDKDNFRKCMKVHYGIEILNMNRIEKRRQFKRYMLLLIALITISSYLFLENTFLPEVRSFLLTLAVWEYINQHIYREEDDDIKKYIYDLLDDAEII